MDGTTRAKTEGNHMASKRLGALRLVFAVALLAGCYPDRAAFDGTLRIDSPAGGPTTMTIEVPCGLS